MDPYCARDAHFELEPAIVQSSLYSSCLRHVAAMLRRRAVIPHVAAGIRTVLALFSTFPNAWFPVLSQWGSCEHGPTTPRPPNVRPSSTGYISHAQCTCPCNFVPRALIVLELLTNLCVISDKRICYDVLYPIWRYYEIGQIRKQLTSKQGSNKYSYVICGMQLSSNKGSLKNWRFFIQSDPESTKQIIL